MSRFDEKIREYYESKELAEDRVEAILARSGRGRGRSRWSRYYPMVAAAAVLAVAFVGLQRHVENVSLKEGVLGEIAMNHGKELDVEFAADKYLELQGRLDRLDFSILPARSALVRNYRLVGGRYCSIRGELAAQLKVEDKVSGEWLTLYITPLTDQLERISSSEEIFEGVHIRCWQEEGRFFALAGSE